MKKFIYISGVLLVNIFIAGSIFKLLHLPGAAILMITGLTLFALVFLPIALYSNFKQTGKKQVAFYTVAYLSMLLVFTSVLFKVMHWEGSGMLMLVSIPIPFILFLPVFLYFNRKHESNQSLNFIGVMMLLVYVAVFSSLLSLSVSRDILVSLTTGAQETEQSQFALRQKIEHDVVELTSNDSLNEVGKLYKKTKELCSQIDQMKTELIAFATGQRVDDKNLYGELDLWAVNSKDEYYKTSVYMHNNGNATRLKAMLIEYRTSILDLSENEDVAVQINSLLDTRDVASVVDPGEKINWEEKMFPQGAFLMTVLGALNSVENAVLLSENILLESMY